MISLTRAVAILLSTVFSIASAEELFQDLALRQGFNLSAVSTLARPIVRGPVLQQDSATKPLWRLAQWGTKYDIYSTTPVVLGDGSRVLENEAKRVVIHPGGLAGKGLTLAVYGGVEYGGKLRKAREMWPHLLVEQTFSSGFRFADYTQLDFSLDFKVERCDLASSEPVIKRLHTGQITAYFSIRNGNPESSDFKDMIWFGLPLFDVRFDLPPGHQAVDDGTATATGKFICTLPGKRFYDRPTGDGSWHELRGDLVVLVREALAASQAKGFLTDTKFKDLQPTSFNLGWEVTGPYDCAITLKGLRLDGRR